MPGRLLIGTASWTDKPLVESGKFYPPEVKTPEARLRYYASPFSLVSTRSSRRPRRANAATPAR